MYQRLKTATGLAAVLACPTLAAAQDQGGMLWQFNVSDRLSYSENASLTPGNTDTQLTNTLSLGARFSSQTRAESLSFNVSTGLRSDRGDAFDGVETTITQPRANLSYSRTSADAVLSASASLSRDKVEFLRTASDFINEDGELELPEDFNDLTGTGTRTSRSFSTSLRWGETAPVGYSVSLGLSDLRYGDVTDPDLVDSRTWTLGAGLRLNITEVVTANLSWNGRRYEEDTPGFDPVETQIWRTGLSFARPRGAITTGLTLSGDDRLTFNLGRTLPLPTGQLSVSAGVSGPRGGPYDFVGRIGWQQDLPNGGIGLNASQSIDTDADGDQTRNTSLAASYTYQIDPISSLSLGLDYGARTDLATDNQTRTGSVSASYNLRLTDDWALRAGASYNLRDEPGAARATAQNVFMGVSRSFTFRP